MDAHIPQHEGRGKELVVRLRVVMVVGMQSVDRHTGDYSDNKSQVSELAITLLMLYQKLYFCGR